MRMHLRFAALLMAGTMLAGPAFAQSQSGTTQSGAAQSGAAQGGATADQAAQPQAQAAAPMTPETVVARVNGHDITMADVSAAAASLPPQLQGQIQLVLPALVNRLVDMELVSEKARSEGLDEKPEVKAAMDAAAEDALRQAYLEQALQAALTEEALDKAYQDYIANNPPQEQAHARHILVATEDEAKQIIDELNKGGDFAELAKEHSTDGSSQNGGDLGWFTADQMVKPFSDAAFALKDGEYTKEPVKSQFGWHVIELEGKRTSPQPTREELAGQLQQQIARAQVQKMIADLRDGANIEILLPAPGQGAKSPADQTGSPSGQTQKQ